MASKPCYFRTIWRYGIELTLMSASRLWCVSSGIPRSKVPYSLVSASAYSLSPLGTPFGALRRASLPTPGLTSREAAIV